MANDDSDPGTDRDLDDLIARSGLAWPTTDAALDAWLAQQALPPEELAWVRDAVAKKIAEARGVVAGQAIGTPVVDVAQGPAKKVGRDGPIEPRPARRLSYDDLAVLNRQLLELVEARAPLPAGLASCAGQIQSGRLAGVLNELKVDLESGLPLSEAMERRGQALPPIYRELVKAGEVSGDLASPLALLAEQAEIDSEIDVRAREALAYPAVVFGALVITVGGFYGLVASQFRGIFESMNVELPWLTENILGFGDFMNENAIVTFPALILFALVGPWALLRTGPRIARRFTGRFLPSRRIAELARSLSGFLRRGVPANRAFRALEAAYGASFPPGALARVADRLDAGSTLGASIREERAFPRTFVWLIGASEDVGSLAQTLQEIAERYEREFRRKLRVIEVLVAPIALVILGSVVGLGILSVFLPIFKLQQTLSQ